MARPAKIGDADLLEKLSDVFRDVGYDGASLAALSAATGLQKASLYHRFPGGKEQMAREVMARGAEGVERSILAPLRSSGPPRTRIRAMVRGIDKLYSGGRQACLLNMMAMPRGHHGPFAGAIRKAFKAWVDALSTVVMDASFNQETARFRAERAVMLLQGSLVVSRGTGSLRPFRACLASLEQELLG